MSSSAEVARPTAARGGAGAAVPIPDRAAGGGIDPAALAVWRMFLASHASITRNLEQDLHTAHALPLASYDVLVQLVEAPGRSLRMTELAERVLLSRSGLTRLVDRLEREGLVRREPCASDARGLNAVLTPAGYQRLRDATPTHLSGVDRYVISRLTPEELGTLGELLGRLVPASDARDQ